MKTKQNTLGSLLLAGCFAAGLALSQDQTVIISQAPAICPAVGDVNSASLTEAQAPTLISNVLGAMPAADTYYIIHDVKYIDGQFAVDQQHWYIYYAGWTGHSPVYKIVDSRIDNHFNEARIYGSRNVALVYIHSNIPGTNQATALARASQVLHDSNKAQSIIVRTLIGGDKTNPDANVTLVNQTTHHPLAGIGSGAGAGVIDGAFGDLASLSYQIAITKKLPAPIQNLQGIAGLIVGQGAGTPEEISLDTVNVCGGKVFSVTPLPSDMTAAALTGSGSQQKQLSKNTFDNEKKYWYDFSLALPLKSYNELTVNSSDFTLTAKKVQKQNLFAVVDLSPIPYDTKKPQFQLIPVFLYGMPITGQPLNHHLFAAAIGLNRVQFFAGVLLSHNQLAGALLTSGTSTSTATGVAPVKSDWGTHLVYGINFPVSTVVNLLKSSSTSK